MFRQQKVLFPKISPDCPNSAAVLQLPNSRAPHYHDHDKPSLQIYRTKRKHVLKACERCRVKKSKCDGMQPCGRCLAYNHACIFRDRKATQEKVYSRGFVEMLISQHAVHLQALQDLYRRCVSREGLPGSPLEESTQGRPGTHAILDRLGLIKHAEEMIEDPRTVLADIVEYVKALETTSDGIGSAEYREPSETTPSDDPSPEPSTPREVAEFTEPSIAGTMGTSHDHFRSYQMKSNIKSVQQEQHHHHHHHDINLAQPMGPFPYQENVNHSQLLGNANVHHSKYAPMDGCCETPVDMMWSSPGHHSSSGLLPFSSAAERGHFLAMEQESYPILPQYGNPINSTFLQR
ncbi:hypothetical protein BGW36DRAFT_151072 [Talaromyces proteolyticus]|uniref:Zn(2)-C6 fungal-type domain-containing protein n=1 Tax=Talaromyces proteolyticus TaxID=1131652 RepID=A0AAD4Q1T2_9EURO|nr:uncharacterized protein BGW36DRAFT_151072 [Talaromyces proteolyticus]KAH8698835.1 hypothetical protein BGW36DRAFT_151072 [Talaromyces proteolyticus]